MKRKNKAIIILMIAFFIILGTKVEATTGIVNEETVKLRKQPDSKTVLDLLDEGDEVEIIEHEDGWYKVKAKTELGKVTGYISEDLIDVEDKITSEKPKENNSEIEETPVEEPEEITENLVVEEPQEIATTVSKNIEVEDIQENEQYKIEQEVSIKILPLINAKEKAKISGNINIVETINDWSRIENETEIGWIRTNILEKALIKIDEPIQEEQPVVEQPEQEIQTEEPATEEDAPEEKIEPETTDTATEINKTGYVSAEGLRVRKGPSTDDEEITSLSKNDKVEIIGQEGNWYKIKIDGEIGYISAKYISDIKLPETTSRSGSALKDEQSNKVEEEEKESNSEESTTGTTGTEVIEYAKQYLGYKYVSGGASPEAGFDCSGFTTYVYKHFGITLNRSSKDQIKNGVAVEKSNLQLGDIVLFNNDANTKIGHVGIYVGNGNFIHASNPSDGVKITTLESGYYAKRYVGARRVI